jgi:hypothetical protein
MELPPWRNKEKPTHFLINYCTYIHTINLGYMNDTYFETEVLVSNKPIQEGQVDPIRPGKQPSGVK